MKNKSFLAFLAVFVLLGVISLEAQSRRLTQSRPMPTVRQQASRPAPPRQVVRRPALRTVRVRISRPYYSNRSYGYGYGNYGYGSSYGRYYMLATGIRFHLELVSKEDQKMVKRGVVTIDGGEQGIVNRYDSWQNGHIALVAGSHSVLVELEDGRFFETEVLIQSGQILHVYVRF